MQNKFYLDCRSGRAAFGRMYQRCLFAENSSRSELSSIKAQIFANNTVHVNSLECAERVLNNRLNVFINSTFLVKEQVNVRDFVRLLEAS